jgi:tetratricopeptide (TPR) repeat protein
MESIKRSDVEIILRKLNECKKHLQLGRIYACLLEFGDLLEKTLSTHMLVTDEKHITQEINTLQRQIQDSKSFKDVFGPVTFHDDDKETTLSFIKQLIVVEEEEILSSQNGQNNGAGQITDTESMEQLVLKIVLLIDRGAHEKARQIYADNEALRSLIVCQYNRSGIVYRKEGRHDEAFAEFEKALKVEPADEGLYYNIARVHLEKGNWVTAKKNILEALKINSAFKEGHDLLNYIQNKIPE